MERIERIELCCCKLRRFGGVPARLAVGAKPGTTLIGGNNL
jgi:hypothetical protein